ncbi:MAG TPA: type I glutamate--ammonia ligase [Deinococcales bacterium]|nr:type I glutamate--ammonia ligase [Deinococcales bacterium]
MPTSKAEILRLLQAENVSLLRLQFSDVLGLAKNVEVPASQFEKALDGEVMFDGSSVEGFMRSEESDMLLKPDYETIRVLPPSGESERQRGRVARLICDVNTPQDEPYPGDPRGVLKRQVARAKDLGFDVLCGPEVEFFLFARGPDGSATLQPHDAAGYFDLAAGDRGEAARADMVAALISLGLAVEGAHHEVAPGQHEIDLRHDDALRTADALATCKVVMKRVAMAHGLHASFMPKPIDGVNGSGLHTHLSLARAGRNAFHDPEAPLELSTTALNFIGGLLENAPAIAALTNPLVNSYKRLVPGFEAPSTIAWSASNRSAMVRVPARRGAGTRAELRMPDPACNPYLAIAAMIAAGLDGIGRQLEPPPPIQRNIQHMSVRDRRRHRVRSLPANLADALDELEESPVMREALGEQLLDQYLEAKHEEWRQYSATVHRWELERYLEVV